MGKTTGWQLNLNPEAKPAAAAPGAAAAGSAAAPAAAPAGRRLLRGPAGAPGRGRRLSQITAAQAEAEAAISQSVDNLYSLGPIGPFGQHTYEWLVPEAAAPGPGDGDAVAYAYVSGVDTIKHINSGLAGPLIIYAKGKMPTGDARGAAAGGSSKDGAAAVQEGDDAAVRELPLLFNIQNEMQSEFFEYNLRTQSNASGVAINKAVRLVSRPETVGPRDSSVSVSRRIYVLAPRPNPIPQTLSRAPSPPKTVDPLPDPTRHQRPPPTSPTAHTCPTTTKQSPSTPPPNSRPASPSPT